ncbi:MAG: rod shape-determining protein MreC [Flavobacteriaceae bacterium]|nr:rod shape-determining protein MreC [Flavobacteriaceae bacterium]
MQQIVHFIIKYKYFLLFLLLEVIAVSLTIRSHSYHTSKFVNSANALTGGFYNKINSVREYSNLKTYNEQLLEENTRLKNLLSIKEMDTSNTPVVVIDSNKYHQKYSYIPAKVIKNQYHKKYNYLTINKGAEQNIKPDLGVINSRGIIGIVNTVKNNYSTVLSILNDNSKINVRLKKSMHFGTMHWNGKDPNILQLIDLPIRANLKQGDTIVTGGMSTIFPEGLPVGTISSFDIENNAYKDVNINLFNDMTAVGPVYIIMNFDKEEILELEETTLNE